MALYLAGYKDNPITYADAPVIISPGLGRTWKGDHWEGSYNPWLVTPPRNFGENIASIQGFFYVPPPNDIFVLWTYTNITDWPGWEVKYYHFDAGTGEVVNTVSAGSVFGTVYISSIEFGDLGHAYVTWSSSTSCSQINWQTGANESSLWSIDPYYGGWSQRRIFSNILVNKQQNRILGVQYPLIEVWKDIFGTPTIDFSIRIGNTVKDLAYESNNYGWVLMSDAQILKIAWGESSMRLEMASSVQAFNATDLGYYLAYDSSRKRLAVYRWMPDATDGSSRSRIEFYETIPKPQYLLDPVPITSHDSGEYVKFVSKVIGSMGEGFAGATADVELVAPNNHGKVLSPTALSGVVGDINVSYEAPQVAATDTLQLTVEYTDDMTTEGG